MTQNVNKYAELAYRLEQIEDELAATDGMEDLGERELVVLEAIEQLDAGLEAVVHSLRLRASGLNFFRN